MKERQGKPGKMPAFQFYPGDWLRDIGVRALSRHDQSVWFDLLLMMHESERRGVLLLNGRAMSDAAIANALALSARKWKRVRQQLLDNGVASLDETGALLNRRMVRDEEQRQLDRENGTKGGRPARPELVSDADKGHNGEAKANPNPNPPVGQNHNPKAPPSSSSSPSGQIPEKENAGEAQAGDVALLPQIVLAHPWARLRVWTRRDVPQAELVAVAEAVTAECERTGATREVAAMALLEFTRGFSALPPERVQFVTKDIAKWFRQREYRLDPALVGNPNRNPKQTQEGQNGVAGTGNGGRNGKGDVALAELQRALDRNEAALGAQGESADCVDTARHGPGRDAGGHSARVVLDGVA